MYNHRITRISAWDTVRYLFAGGACLGGSVGLLLGLMDRAVSVFGGLFLGLLSALLFSFAGLVLTTVFNLLAPVTGGIAFHVEESKTPAEPKAAEESPGTQQTLFPGK